VRTVEVGNFIFRRKDAVPGAISAPDLELVRLAIPRRVYTESHLRYAAEAVIEVYQTRQSLKGMRIVARGDSPLRHFVAHLAFVD